MKKSKVLNRIELIGFDVLGQFHMAADYNDNKEYYTICLFSHCGTKAKDFQMYYEKESYWNAIEEYLEESLFD